MIPFQDNIGAGYFRKSGSGTLILQLTIRTLEILLFQQEH